MSIDIVCSHCAATLRLPAEHAGQRVLCSSCGGELVVPGRAVAARAVPVAAPPQRRATGAVPPRHGRAATRGDLRREDIDRELTPARRPRSTLAPVLLTLVVVVALGAVVYVFSTRASEVQQPLFKPVPVEDGPEPCTLAAMEAIVRNDGVAETRYRNFVANLFLYRSDPSKYGKKQLAQSEQDLIDMVAYLVKNIQIECASADLGMARSVVEQVTSEWRSQEEASLAVGIAEFEKPEAVASRKQARLASAGDGLTAIDREDRRIDTDARAEIATMLAGVEVPKSYGARARWLVTELQELRREAGEGVNLNGFAYRVARCQELLARFDAWALEEERQSSSFERVESSVADLVKLKDRWRDWSAGRTEGVTKESVESDLSDIRTDLEEVGTWFPAE